MEASLVTNVLAKLVFIVVTNWTGYEGFKLEYESNMTYVDCQVWAVGVNNSPWQQKVKYDERVECPFESVVTVSTNTYGRVGEVIRIEKYVFEDGREMEKSRSVIGHVKQAGRKMVKMEWQWDIPVVETGKVAMVLCTNSVMYIY